MKPFDYVRPTTLPEALAILDERGPDAVVIAGGTDLIVSLNARQINPRCVVDLKRIDELKFIRRDGDALRIGSRTTFTDLLASDLIRDHANVLAQAAREAAGPQVRNLGTIGGNLGTASPAGDLIAALVALDATIEVASNQGRKTLAVRDLLIGPKKNCLAKNELIVAVGIPLNGGRSGSAFHKLGNRRAMTISIANAAASVTLSADGRSFERVCLALGSVAPTVVRATAFENALRGRPATGDEVRRALPLVAEAISPITDLRASAWYRAQIAPVLAQRSLEDALALAGGERPAMARPVVKRGRGVAGTFYSCTVPGGVPNPYSINMQMREDGSVVVQAGGCDIGQGSTTVIATIVAEALGVTVDQVTVHQADTGTSPYDWGTVSSRQTFAGGNAALAAAAQIRTVLLDSASKKLNVPVERLALEPGVIVDTEPGTNTFISIPEAAALSHFAFRQLPNSSATYFPKSSPPGRGLQGDTIASFYYIASAVDVDVDTETGVVSVRDLYSVVDCGKAISPILVEGQVEGGAMQAVGWALREDAYPGLSPVDEPSGFNPAFEPKDLSNYPIATSLDMPNIHAAFVEVPEQNGPFGAKACGEITAITPTPAILNAIDDAVGIRIFDLPASPEKVLRKLQDKRLRDADATA
ncbi:MAG: molybdopterin-dependent oxidoreductase [Rhodoplanes sp.]|uniref:molybdopterin cofactor-binding domain-containing protein n=1 Tax=Rhodoplanes sp. TaxID=1968906 RepID=UPI0017C89A3E|nr:molybdopterin cofactor-binding domain-containing protein [Rhodoplanes sp.]NVO15269.1 molybdopterin-dependent oxidoreductase [Rhodoplanes sp.]